MTKEFEMKDLGLMRYFLGLEVRQDKSGIFVSQEAYAKDILKRFKMIDCNPVSTPMEPGLKLSKYDGEERVDPSNYRSLVGCLRYLTCTRPDLCLSVGIISCFMEDPGYTHWKAAKRILRYVQGTISQGLYYSKSDKYKLVGYSDSDWCRDVDNRKSMVGYVFFMGNTTFTWVSKKEPTVALSTCEAEENGKQREREAEAKSMRTVKEWFMSSQALLSMLLVQIFATGMQLLSRVILVQGTFIFALITYRHVVSAICVAPFALYFERGRTKKFSWRVLFWIFVNALAVAV
ncbi:uncharacterized mitochondrial protein AtMg00810-like [Gastrolobium bilobum]|uniref:uncharacterized mitochondrial protein AtMg00810-like n=1 Tax=Gastrolobium bilobum TaxID=150636 RepID=UPI002AB155A3|nr:uncharacterized mitochondrial protein AtMg00810-like [Gastrolobium bilobum]